MVMLSIYFHWTTCNVLNEKELIPNINIPVVTISTTWSGAVSEDVEAQVTKENKRQPF